MTGTATGRQKEHPANSSLAHSSDEQVIGRCLKGDQEAWSALIDKYKNLIYSIPIKLGMYQDAGDIFQSVCVDLLSELQRLREHRALPKWLMQTCYRKCLRSLAASLWQARTLDTRRRPAVSISLSCATKIRSLRDSPLKIVSMPGSNL